MDTPPDGGSRLPAGEVHAWEQGNNATACGVPLRRAGLIRFPHVDFADLDPLTGSSADAVRWTCPTCQAATGGRARGRSWVRMDPRP
ncbi:hypothetical protein [Kineococcus rhizosphaerae]|uniref:Uncharacterized protein n=1 Tax=Kineococcus rhizosphaerae TaxID=559628 RepID=A0A2T0R3D3_9ACTN|nr:hypothetical protein [Kineococcus rhizosphaerae]PRY14531.1 hypothetical protein CLV37_10689 [Kineococcus rhizosphaerae]